MVSVAPNFHPSSGADLARRWVFARRASSSVAAAPTLSDIRAKLLGHSDQIGNSIAPLIFQLLLTRRMFSPAAQVTPWLEDQCSWQNLQIQKL